MSFFSSDNSNTSQFVKTYGKPRRTQNLGRNSVWHDDLADDFDKCLGIEDVQQTTFTSPEQFGSVTMYKPVKYKKNDENKMNTIGGWSMRLQSTMSGRKDNSTTKRRNIEYSSERNKLISKSSHKKRKDNSFNKIYSIMDNKSTPSKTKVTPVSVKKLNNRFHLSKQHCSTPLQKSMLFSHGTKVNNISSKMKKKKNKTKTNLFNTLNVSSSSEYSNIPNSSHFNSFDSLSERNYKLNPFEESVQISSFKFPIKELATNNKYTQHSIDNDHKSVLKPIPIKSKICNKKKKYRRCLKKTNWYSHAFNVLRDEKLNSLEGHIDAEIINSEDSVENLASSNNTLYYDIINENQELKNTESPNVTKITDIIEDNKDSSQLLAYFDNELDHPKNIKSGTHAGFDQSSLLSVEDIGIQHNESQVGSDLESQILCITVNTFSGMKISDTTGQYDQFISEETILNNFDESSKLTVDKSTLSDNINSDKSISSERNCTIINLQKCTDIYRKEHSSNSINVSLENYSQNFSKKKSLMCNDSMNLSKLQQTSLFPVKDSGIQHNDNQLAPDSESQISLITNTFSDITNDVTTGESDQFITEETILNDFDESFKSTIDKLTLEDNVISNSISSGSQSSSSSDQNCTAIYLQKSTDIHPNENNSNSIKVFLNDENNVSVENCSQYSSNSKKESLKCNDNINISNDRVLESSQNLNTLNDLTNFSYNTFETSTSRRRRYAARYTNCFNIGTIDEDSTLDINNSTEKYQDHTKSISSQQNTPGFRLEPGKKWRRSVLIVRSFIDGNLDQTTKFTENLTKGRKWTSTVDDVLRQQSINTSIYQSNVLRNSICSSSQRYSERNSIENKKARKYIIESCNERKIISFESWMESKKVSKETWKKVGEGVYGEVFMYEAENNCRVIKIIPIEGQMRINSERQKCMSEVYSEILIANELNNMRDATNWNQTNAFCKVENISCVQGKYPENLIKLWSHYNVVKGSDNDNPNILPDNQLFMILEMENGGIDVETFIFNSASQALFAFIQIVFGLAVAEQQFDFEHRDLHIGNILVNKIARSRKISYTLDGKMFNIPSKGVKITIIDFTLSRMTYINKPIYNDLSNDTELFSADGDYQFEIYRLMKKETDDQWDLYTPKTNIYWLHYVLDKMLKSVHYKNIKTITHKTGLEKLQSLEASILLFNSAKSFAESDIILDLI